jgi:hypothetical protein
MHKIACLLLAAVLAPAAANAAAESMFGRMDADRDGRITSAEHAAGARSMFGQMDADRDAVVTAAEMGAAHAAVTGREAADGEPTPAQKIAVIDADRDGRLSASEHARGSRRLFARMDADVDGRLTPAEFEAGHAALDHEP